MTDTKEFFKQRKTRNQCQSIDFTSPSPQPQEPTQKIKPRLNTNPEEVKRAFEKPVAKSSIQVPRLYQENPETPTDSPAKATGKGVVDLNFSQQNVQCVFTGGLTSKRVRAVTNRPKKRKYDGETDTDDEGGYKRKGKHPQKRRKKQSPVKSTDSSKSARSSSSGQSMSPPKEVESQPKPQQPIAAPKDNSGGLIQQKLTQIVPKLDAGAKISEIDRQIQQLLQLKQAELQKLEQLQTQQDDNGSGGDADNVKQKIDISQSGSRRKKKTMLKKDVYKNVDLEALNSYMTSDNFLVQSAQEVPGLIFETPVIDINFWRQQQYERQSSNKKRDASQQQNQPDQEMVLNIIDLGLDGKKKAQADFLTQQQQYLESQQPQLLQDKANPLQQHFDKVTYSITSSGLRGEPKILITIQKSAIKDKNLLHWISNKDQSNQLQQLWEQEMLAKQAKPQKQKGVPKPKKKLEASNEDEQQEVIEECNKEDDVKLLFQQKIAKTGKPAQYITDTIKVEDGLIKYEYSNRFNLRLINHQFGFKQSLESFINQQRVKQMQDQVKSRKGRKKGGSTLLKIENGSAVKEEDDNFSIGGDLLQPKTEINTDDVELIDYQKDALPDFTKVPEEIIKGEMQRNGFKTCQVKKGIMYQLLGEIWNYRKMGSVPKEYIED